MTCRALWFSLFLLAYGLGGGMLHCAEAPATPGRGLSEAETDALLDAILKRAQTIERVQAEIITTKQGSGLIKDKLVAYETLKLEAPDLVWLQSRGETEKPLPANRCSLMLFDGSFFWELDAKEPGEARRMATRRAWKTRASAVQHGAASVLSYVILGGEDVRTAKELRGRFEVEARLESVPAGEIGQTHHFTLKRREDGLLLELWIQPGKTLPWKVRTTEKRKLLGAADVRGAKGYRLRIEERRLLKVQTNLSELAPFPVDVFLFPLAADIEVEDAGNDFVVIKPAQLRQDIAAVKARILSRRAKAKASDATPAKGVSP